MRCPHCGRYLKRPLKDGLSSCLLCNAIFESTYKNKLLSGAWEIIRGGDYGLDRFKFLSKLEDAEAEFVYNLIADQQYSIDEFRKAI